MSPRLLGCLPKDTYTRGNKHFFKKLKYQLLVLVARHFERTAAHRHPGRSVGHLERQGAGDSAWSHFLDLFDICFDS